MAQTRNENFYNNLLEYEKQGKILFGARTVSMPEKFFRIKIGVPNRYLSLHIDIVDFVKEIEDMIESKNLYTQNMLEQELQCTNTKIVNLVNKGEYEMINRGFKLYLKKDW